ncbi:ABC transporter substrate-binding protein [Sphingomonas donggukensis]|uniref:ABC transporter substrate-binding protein n=1 Tax=Sphingomonas donggukensis TaxID=2949093 RepID=A0ABY4TPR7_9SPHN|nr:ABC transporter substrate-binding protein [Sphingomonas donggukensis]URW74384.1 ABC transporter substrate-binding protein [Sphingomonas donggukensis]
MPVVVSVIGGPVNTAATGRAPPSPATRTLVAATAQGLVQFDAAGGIEPGLAERWIVRDDNRSFIFRLREASWPDGRAVVAEDIVPVLRRAVAARPGTAVAPYLTAIDEIVAMTPQVIEVRLKRPRPDLLKLFAQGDMTIAARGGIAGAGPFRIVAGAAGPGVMLRPLAETDDDEAPPPEAFVRLRGERASVAVLRFADKRSDMVTGGTLADWPLLALAGVAPANIRVDPAAGLFGLAIANRAGFLASADHRAALAQAIDRTALVGVFRDGWSTSETVLPEQLDAAAAPAPAGWSLLPPDERQAAAAAQVAAWGQPVRLRIALPSGPGMTTLYGQLGAMLRRVGIATVRVPADADADLRLVDQVAPYDSARWYLRTACQPCGAPVAAQIAAARDADTLEERARLLSAADQALAADVAFIPIARPLRWSLVAARLKAFTPNARAAHPLNHLRGDPN